MTDQTPPEEPSPQIGKQAVLLAKAKRVLTTIPRRSMITLSAVLVAGIACGAAVALYTPAATLSPSYSLMRQSLTSENADMRSQSVDDASTISADEAKLSQFESDAATVKAAAAAATARSAVLDAREAAVKAREDAVTAVEAVVAANTFAGDGVYIVGTDIQPGQYRSAGGSGCYWSRNSASGGIIDNYIGDGPAVVTVQASDATLTVSRCGPFTKV